MHTSNHVYYDGEKELHGYLAYNNEDKKPRPAVMVAHDWSGRNAFACQKADMLASLGYVGFAIDMYGQGRTAESNDEKRALMQPLADDRKLLRTRIRSAFNELLTMDMVDKHRIAAIGFCFGGLCVLDLARSGADVSGVVTFHGILGKPSDMANENIKAKILALHGYDDPMATPAQVETFCQEMTEAKVDWQMHMYGNTQHAFTNPKAHDEALGLIYNATAEHRSLQAMKNFLHELFD